MSGKRNRRLKILPDRIFHKIWVEALDTDDRATFLAKMISSDGKTVARPEKYSIDAVLWYDVLRGIFDAAHMDAGEIIRFSGKKKAEISHYFCIPIRTLEDWCSGKSNPPSYVRLMMIREFHLLNLGKNVRLESEDVKDQTKNTSFKSEDKKFDDEHSGIMIENFRFGSRGIESGSEVGEFGVEDVKFDFGTINVRKVAGNAD